jgi:hypothetical protein
MYSQVTLIKPSSNGARAKKEDRERSMLNLAQLGHESITLTSRDLALSKKVDEDEISTSS